VNLESFPHLVSDEDFKKVIAIIRLAVPYTGMILSTREDPELRDELITYGISQISAGSCTGVGGYQQAQQHVACGPNSGQQFEPSDNGRRTRSIRMLCEKGFVPCYCTACYRQAAQATGSWRWPRAARSRMSVCRRPPHFQGVSARLSDTRQSRWAKASSPVR
jgi:2-iminoacetate synthase ThiH